MSTATVEPGRSVTYPRRDTDRLELPMPSQRTCTYPDCTKPIRTRLLCNNHYEKLRRYGTADGNPKVHSLDRLHERIVIDERGCWIWQGFKNHRGYGQVGVRNSHKLTSAHRAVYEKLVGPIPAGLELDHVCRVPSCVNPQHLEPVTHRENMRRAPWTAVQAQLAKTHCPQGHPYAGDNLYVNPQGRRECHACRRARRE